MKLTIAGMGPGPVSMCTLGAVEAARGAGALFLQTARHPVADYLKGQGVAFETLDRLYEDAETFETLGESAAALLKKALRPGGETVLLLSGEGVTAHTLCGAVVRMAREAGAALRLLPGVPLAAPALSEAVASGLPIDGAGGLQTVYASEIEDVRPDVGRTLVVQEVDGFLTAGAVKLWLLEYYPPGHPVCLIYMEGGETKRKVLPVQGLDRQRTDHTSCVVVPGVRLEDRERFGFDALVAIMDRLRGEGGCPWDREQTHETLRQYLIEETYEVLEAIDRGDDAELADELGDVLLQVVFHARIAREQGRFTDRDVTTAICGKMIRRHTHVFGSAQADTAADVLVNWDAIKRDEKGERTRSDSLRSVSPDLPALIRSEKVQDRASRVGFDWDDASIALEKVFEEAKEVRRELELKNRERAGEEIGDLLFAVANVARLSGVRSELALRAATDKFITRFERMEELAEKEGARLANMTLDEMDRLWDRAKTGMKTE
ncbi:MAG: nucleoside triphosphate pyrophosphohydrolase [Christensenellales bacterium]|jgi:tetrapyrrole methylase family protein/MazG family protein